jgi:hypothetical protein
MYGDTAIRGKLYYSFSIFQTNLNKAEHVNEYNRMEALNKREPSGLIPKSGLINHSSSI